MAARARITQIGAQSWLGISKFRRISTVSGVKKVQSDGSSFYSTSSSNRYDKFNGNGISQDHHFTMLLLEIEKLRLAMGKAFAVMRLEKTNNTNKVVEEIHALKADLEAAKNDLMKYCIVIVVSIYAISIGMPWILSSNK